MIKDIVFVGIGSGIGGICRYLISLSMSHSQGSFPWMKSFPDARCVETLLIEGSVRLDLAPGESGRHILLRPGNLVCFDRVTGAVDIQDVDPALFGDYARGNTLRSEEHTSELQSR